MKALVSLVVLSAVTWGAAKGVQMACGEGDQEPSVGALQAAASGFLGVVPARVSIARWSHEAPRADLGDERRLEVQVRVANTNTESETVILNLLSDSLKVAGASWPDRLGPSPRVGGTPVERAQAQASAEAFIRAHVSAATFDSWQFEWGRFNDHRAGGREFEFSWGGRIGTIRTGSFAFVRVNADTGRIFRYGCHFSSRTEVPPNLLTQEQATERLLAVLRKGGGDPQVNIEDAFLQLDVPSPAGSVPAWMFTVSVSWEEKGRTYSGRDGFFINAVTGEDITPGHEASSPSQGEEPNATGSTSPPPPASGADGSPTP